MVVMILIEDVSTLLMLLNDCCRFQSMFCCSLENLQALKKRFAMLRTIDVVKITATFDAPYNTAGTIDEYL